MKKFANEQDTAAKPPEPQGERAPEEAEQQVPGAGEFDSEESEEETEGVEWDGSEAELVADEGAAEYEEYNTGIALHYTLKEQEIFPVLVKTQYTQKRIALSVFAAVLGLVLGVYYLLQGAAGRGEFTSLGIVCLLLVVLVVPSPLYHLRNSAKAAADGKEIRIKIYPDHLEMGFRPGEEIPLDGTIQRLTMKGLIVLYIGSQIVILPLRCIEPAVLPEVQAMLFAGTRPVK